MKKKAIEKIPFLGLGKNKQEEKGKVCRSHCNQDYGERRTPFPGSVQKR